MAEQIIEQPIIAPVAAPEAPVSTPVQETPVTTEAPAEAVVDTILGPEPTKVEEAKPAEEAKPVITEETKPEVKPEEKKPEDAKIEEKKPEEVKPVEFEKFTLPEGMKVDDTVIGEFTSMLGSFESVSKAEHAEVQKFGQALVNYHTSRLQDAITNLTNQYESAWKKQTEDWRTQFESDPEIGGKRRDTTINAAEEFIRNHGGNEDQQKELREILRKTGLGNHPAIIRSYANAGLSKMLTEPTPVPAQAPSPSKMTRAQKMYGVKK